jgi:NADPH:quinone reductase
MKAVVCRQFGPPEELVIAEVDNPIAGEKQIVVEVKAAAVTFPDALIIQDKYQYKAELPFTPGGEISGVVSQVGSQVQGFAIGDRVKASAGQVGGFAEQLLVPMASVSKLPEDASFGESLGLLYTYGTAYYGLKYRANIQAGESLLVLGAAGGVGLAAVELGKLMGAHVIAAASSDDKLAICQSLGAQEVINYSTEDLKKRSKALTDGKGIDVIMDCVGGDYAEAALRAIAWEGRFLVVGFTAGVPAMPLNLALLKSCQIIGVFLGAQLQRNPDFKELLLGELTTYASSGKLNPLISKRYPLQEAPLALRDMLERKVVGRVIIEP